METLGKQPNRYFLTPCASGHGPEWPAAGLRRRRRQNWEPAAAKWKGDAEWQTVGMEKCVQGKHLSTPLTRRPPLASDGG